jgi:dienelactone hydrolase
MATMHETRQEIRIPTGYTEVSGTFIEGELIWPEKARGVVVFAHGSGSGRLSPRNQAVARHLRTSGVATLLLDMLTRAEAEEDGRHHQFRFDIALLCDRMIQATDWLREHANHHFPLKIGYYGASTGAAAAIMAAAELGERRLHAIVSRGGRPDLAGKNTLNRLKTPTLLIVGGKDTPVIALNEQAFSEMRGIKRMALIPGASHLFEEPGTLVQVCELASQWFEEYL